MEKCHIEGNKRGEEEMGFGGEKAQKDVPNCPECAGPVMRRKRKEKRGQRETVNKGNQPPTTM